MSESTQRSRSSPAPPAASARPPPSGWPPTGFAVAVLDLKAEDGAGHGRRHRRRPAAARSPSAPTSATPSRSQAAVDRIAAELGPPVVLVNNAGVTRDNLLFKMTESDWDLVMHVHLRGSFLMSRAAQKHMTEAKWGRIVNLSSTSALGNRGQANYSTAKAGLQGFTKTLAIELGKFGVTANAIAPGFIVTRHDEGDRGAHRPGLGAYVAERAAGDPGARAGQPEDIAHTVSFLVSEGAGFRLRPGHLRRRRPPRDPWVFGPEPRAFGPKVLRCARGSGRGRGRRRRTRRCRPRRG